MNKQDYVDVERYLFNKMKKLPTNLDYHSIHHTKDVVQAAERLAKMEKLKEHEVLTAKTAALFHDSGFLVQYKNNEPIGAKIAKVILPKFNYSKKEIGIITKAILATTVPQKPRTKYDNIVCDADLDNLGRKDFFVQTERVRKEFEKHGMKSTKKEWNERALKLLQNHEYWTASARKLRNKIKKINEKKIINLLKN